MALRQPVAKRKRKKAAHFSISSAQPVIRVPRVGRGRVVAVAPRFEAWGAGVEASLVEVRIFRRDGVEVPRLSTVPIVEGPGWAFSVDFFELDPKEEYCSLAAFAWPDGRRAVLAEPCLPLRPAEGVIVSPRPLEVKPYIIVERGEYVARPEVNVPGFSLHTSVSMEVPSFAHFLAMRRGLVEFGVGDDEGVPPTGVALSLYAKPRGTPCTVHYTLSPDPLMRPEAERVEYC